ncbi:transmembrane protein 275-like [Puntigrus tetrazona]|uniref:transmembrane protein 275-like n=1 Tax=Puntigrus tetrazona TaxID=1606681 RepID=UPI001C8A28A3|nr:transmembrane protein 275-like [Puntigrus tetrazona]
MSGVTPAGGAQSGPLRSGPSAQTPEDSLKQPTKPADFARSHLPGHSERMVFSNEEARSGERRVLRSQGLPSPALCCACGLCIMLAGINITLVGALAFTKLLPLNNPPIIIGPILLLVAFSFFGACCICSRRSIRQSSLTPAGRDRWPLMRMGGAVFEMETSEPTLQDTTAIQLSPANSPSPSHRCSHAHLPGAPPHSSETSVLKGK